MVLSRIGMLIDEEAKEKTKRKTDGFRWRGETSARRRMEICDQVCQNPSNASTFGQILENFE
jgi:hypothetical protein